MSYKIESGESASGNAQRVTNLLNGLDDYLKELKTKIDDKRLHLTQLKQEDTEENPYLQQVEVLEKEIKETREEIGE